MENLRSSLLIVGIHKLIIRAICNVVGHAKAARHHAVLYRGVCARDGSAHSGGAALMGHVVVSSYHHIGVFVHLVLLDTAALIEAHFTK